ncbi:MAG: zinc-binding alcohol dehydrogenase family protein [Bacteroidales bacterium]|nr:zinc-binding alcohol dehydrogenase family protein [Bacteroidales bacterium]
MKSVKIISKNLVKVLEVDKPAPAADEVLLKVKYIGLCGSDLSSFLGKNPMVNYPVVPGHEIAAEIVELGSAVPAHLALNQTVTVNPYTNCGDCSSCRNGRVNACQFNQTLGVQRDGALSEYVVVKWDKILIDDCLSPTELALTEPLSVGFHAIARGRVIDTDTVVVLGCGMIGAGAIIGAAVRGARVIAVDIDDEKLTTAKRLGAKYTINSKSNSLGKQLSELTNGEGPDVVIEAAGNPATYLAAVNEVAFTGRVVCIGYANTDIAFATKIFVQKELDILGSRNALHNDIQSVINYLKEKTCPVDSLISMEIKPEETASALQNWADNPGKIMKILVKMSD